MIEDLIARRLEQRRVRVADEHDRVRVDQVHRVRRVTEELGRGAAMVEEALEDHLMTGW